MDVLYYLKNSSIDKKQWDKCIINSINGNVYAYSWFLDMIYDDWDAIVNKDYTAVMPIPFANAERNNRVEVSSYTKRLGIFTSCELDEKLIQSFLQGIPENIQEFYYPLNKYNWINSDEWPGQKKHIYELDLIRRYSRSRYSPNVVELLDLARARSISVNTHVNMNEFISMYINYNRKAKLIRSENEIHQLKRIVSRLLHKRMAEIYGAYNEVNEMIAACLFVWTNRKLCLYLLAKSKHEDANKGLVRIIDRYIENHSEKNITLTLENFSGTDWEIFKGFGAKQCELYEIRLDKRKWYKKIFSYGKKS